MANNKEPSTSSSSSKKNQKRVPEEIDNSQNGKKLKTEHQQKKLEKTSFNDLPPEMLMEVLKYLDTKALFTYRLVDRKWNGVATEILQSRHDSEVKFTYLEDTGSFELIGKEDEDEKSLLDFIECFHDSNNFPYTRFCFDQVDCLAFDNKHWIEFISDFEEHIKCLKLSTSTIYDKFGLTLFTGKLRDLLLIKLPKLEEFGLNFCHSDTFEASRIELFPPSDENTSTASEVQLPHLKVLHLDHSMFSNCTGIITDLFLAAINLKKIQSYSDIVSYTPLENFHLLQSLGKLDCLEFAFLASADNLLANMNRISAVPLDFKLKRLILYLESFDEQKNLWIDAKIFISKLFESCKDSLEALATGSLRCLNDVELPRFSKLAKIVCLGDEWMFSVMGGPSLPFGRNPIESFPVLDTLKLQTPWTTILPEEVDEIPCIPTLRSLKVPSEEMNKMRIAQISILCPNLKELEISVQHDPFSDRCSGPIMNNFPEVGSAIWTHLTKLQTLILCVSVDGLDNAFPAFDSCITGFSKQYCKSLCHLLVADKLWRKLGSRVKVPEAEMKAERKYPSILDLKDLKSFELHVLHRFGDIKLEHDSKRNGPTWISRKCAFELMKSTLCEVEKRVLRLDSDSNSDGEDTEEDEDLEESWRL